MYERLNYAPCGFMSITTEGIITEVNQTFLEWMGYEQKDLLNEHVESLMSIANKLIFHSYFYPTINLNEYVEELFISFKDSKGITVPYLLNGRRYKNDGVERIDCILVQMKKRIDYELELRSAKKQMEEAYVAKDQALANLEQLHLEIEKKQTELMEMNAILVELSVTDKLTGLKNRRFFQEKLEEHIALYRETGKFFSLLILDIDHFKKVNDTYGHQVGDEVLVQLAHVLTTQTREADIAARYGGEEFVVILPNTDLAESKIIAEQLRQTVEHAQWKTGSLTVSIGIATFTEQDSDATILKNADQALYASKENGRNRVTHISEITENAIALKPNNQ
ncbi:chemotaxis protein CheY [Lysinibacillus contaminans]|uniref:Chemotaxis protein CheY n=1 Tax=Lysinibacillus contaminans TaxID=1293441 RepID=A0ABR5JYH6_9BACI|nr:sensor domain-containing diguanylate cyclase [Lysinibacillus contaminans]KOS67701.1 chemotaxis protein CheY [Lysinibacillus contaminans]